MSYADEGAIPLQRRVPGESTERLPITGQQWTAAELPTTRAQDARAKANMPDGATDEDYQRFRAAYDNARQNGDLTYLPTEPAFDTVDSKYHPRWNGFDTFLRRAVMIAAAIILWLMLAAGLISVLGGAWVISQLSGNDSSTSTVDTTTTDPNLWNTDPTVPVPGVDGCDPDVEDC